MIYIFMALYCEAKPIIEILDLHKCSDINKFQVFTNDNYILTITGTGSLKAAMAVTYICAKFETHNEDILINIGTAASNNEKSKIGDIIYCNKIIDEVTKRVFYPDILYAHDFLESTIITCSKTVSKLEIVEYDSMIFDMEAAGIYQAGSMFFYAHNLIFLKVISDYGVNENEEGYKDNVNKNIVDINNVDKNIVGKSDTNNATKDYNTGDNHKKLSEDITELINNNKNQLNIYFNQICKIVNKCKNNKGQLVNNKENSFEIKDIDNFTDKLATDLCCSVTMKNQLRQYIKYCSLTGVDYVGIVEELYSNEILPCNNKREGKIQFERIKERLIQ